MYEMCLYINLLFRLQKYKKFESNSQQFSISPFLRMRCFDCKSTKNLRAIHNYLSPQVHSRYVVSTAKVQKIWEQFTTCGFNNIGELGCFDCKSTKNLRAIHNPDRWRFNWLRVVSTAKVQKIWEQFTTALFFFPSPTMLFRLQKYKKFESNSQLASRFVFRFESCFDCKSTKNLRAIHNYMGICLVPIKLFRLQKYKKFESNSQHVLKMFYFVVCCFDCKSTKNLRAIHNASSNNKNSSYVVSTAKVQKIWEQFTTLMANLLSFSHERQDVQGCTFGCRSMEVTIPDWWCDRW